MGKRRELVVRIRRPIQTSGMRLRVLQISEDGFPQSRSFHHAYSNPSDVRPSDGRLGGNPWRSV